ncbi:hypothetical protein [Caldalkalibacillus mannanilyticus]|uniref:hypothetical protein n=1 Tax=Caldalkalibacillus mannanilyticus TaxID=1418 RepID=UPI00046803C5|nr:hypothetical protein [Caldalkalibacillus mannanilyticus]
MYKKSLLTLAIVTIVFALALNSFSANAASKKKISFDEKLEIFHAEFDKTQDFEKSLEKLIEKHPEISIVSYNKKTVSVKEDGTFQEIEDGDLALQEVDPKRLTWSDTIFYDNDSQKYNYTGGWNWQYLMGGDPYDVIGVYPNDASKMTLSPGTNLTLRGYNSRGNLEAYWSTGGSTSGPVQLATPLDEKGVAFWIKEGSTSGRVIRGTISVNLGKVTIDPNARIQLQYNHSYTSTDITGVGGSVSVKDKGGGFNVTWEKNVTGQGPYYSPGGWIK